MKITTTFDVIIVGGGLAGLTSAIHLSTRKKRVLLIEKNEYPKHKVCGEYISNEVLPYLNSLGINPINEGAKQITKVHISTTKSNLIKGELPLGGFGMSRYFLDDLLVKKARLNGVQILKDTVDSIHFKKDSFTITTKSSGVFQSKVYRRCFWKKIFFRPKNEAKIHSKKISVFGRKNSCKRGVSRKLGSALHNFKGGYCGVSKVENNAINVCYITEYRSFKKHKNITDFQEQVVFKNKHLRKIFKESSPVFEKPLTISQVSFQTKNPVEDHIIMCGDTAGMIHPLCGNGMGMAISSARLASTTNTSVFKWRNKNQRRSRKTVS